MIPSFCYSDIRQLLLRCTNFRHPWRSPVSTLRAAELCKIGPPHIHVFHPSGSRAVQNDPVILSIHFVISTFENCFCLDSFFRKLKRHIKKANITPRYVGCCRGTRRTDDNAKFWIELLASSHLLVFLN
jgi:hypothetical protein